MAHPFRPERTFAFAARFPSCTLKPSEGAGVAKVLEGCVALYAYLKKWRHIPVLI